MRKGEIFYQLLTLLEGKSDEVKRLVPRKDLDDDGYYRRHAIKKDGTVISIASPLPCVYSCYPVTCLKKVPTGTPITITITPRQDGNGEYLRVTTANGDYISGFFREESDALLCIIKQGLGEIKNARLFEKHIEDHASSLVIIAYDLVLKTSITGIKITNSDRKKSQNCK